MSYNHKVRTSNASEILTDMAGVNHLLMQALSHHAWHSLRLLDISPLDESTSFPCHIITVQIDPGKSLKLFLKDYGSSRLPKDDLPARRERERQIYLDLLRDADLGTATCYGAVWDEIAGLYWLLLEYVEGTELRSCGFEAWVSAAAWLGKLHALFLKNTEKISGAAYLILHDEKFFESKADLALNSVRMYGENLAERLLVVIRNYDRIIATMVDQPQILVHGSYRPQNILISKPNSPSRVCPIDWELAGLGSLYYDLAFLSDGYESPRLDILLDAYCKEVASSGLPIPDRQMMRETINCFRLHKMLKSLSDSAEMNFPRTSVEKILGLAEKIRQRIDHE